MTSTSRGVCRGMPPLIHESCRSALQRGQRRFLLERALDRGALRCSLVQRLLQLLDVLVAPLRRQHWLVAVYDGVDQRRTIVRERGVDRGPAPIGILDPEAAHAEAGGDGREVD